MPNKIILGLVGEIASGKDLAARYLSEKYGAETISFSQPLRDILNLLYQPVSRINLAELGDNLRRQFGQDVLSKVIAQKVSASDKDIIVLPNVRLESDIAYLKHLPGFVLVAVWAEDRERYRRTVCRQQYAGDEEKTWEDFQKDSELYTERSIRELMGKCAYRLDNNGPKGDLYPQLEELLEKLR